MGAGDGDLLCDVQYWGTDGDVKVSLDVRFFFLY